jgi:hypothetical protein
METSTRSGYSFYSSFEVANSTETKKLKVKSLMDAFLYIVTLTPKRIRENILIIEIYAESITLILCGLARIVSSNEVMRK